jgi:hypothetical protein
MYHYFDFLPIKYAIVAAIAVPKSASGQFVSSVSVEKKPPGIVSLQECAKKSSPTMPAITAHPHPAFSLLGDWFAVCGWMVGDGGGVSGGF